MADEATDASNKEQLDICICFVNQLMQEIEKHLLSFSECVTRVSEEAISSRLLHHLDAW